RARHRCAHPAAAGRLRDSAGPSRLSRRRRHRRGVTRRQRPSMRRNQVHVSNLEPEARDALNQPVESRRIRYLGTQGSRVRPDADLAVIECGTEHSTRATYECDLVCQPSHVPTSSCSPVTLVFTGHFRALPSHLRVPERSGIRHHPAQGDPTPDRHSKLSCQARRTAARRSVAPSLWKMLLRCVFTVLTDMCISAAISAVSSISLTRRSTSRSRLVSGSTITGVSAAGGCRGAGTRARVTTSEPRS